MALDPTIVEAVANYNFKANTERATLNMDAHQQRLQLLAEASLAKQLETMNTIGPSEAVSEGKLINSDLAAKFSELGGSISAIQQLLKGAQTTRPETGA